MNDNQGASGKAQGEWTAESVRKMMGHPDYDKAWAVADAHNAALAAEREKLVDALNKADLCLERLSVRHGTNHSDLLDINNTRAALAKVKEGVNPDHPITYNNWKERMTEEINQRNREYVAKVKEGKYPLPDGRTK